MILSDKTILEYGEKLVSPFNPNNVQPNSYDITLGNEFLEPDRTTVVIGEKAPCYEKIEKEFYIIPPFGFILATTEEYVKIPTDVTGFVYGRSSVGRCGLFIHNAGLLDAGFEGTITLELFNCTANPIVIKSGTRIGQIVFDKLDKTADNEYNGKYQKQKGVTGSRTELDYI